MPDIGKEAPNLIVDPQSVDLSDTPVGETQTETITISANTPVKINKVNWDTTINGFSITSTCGPQESITRKLNCTITAKYAPTTSTSERTTPVSVEWYPAEQTEEVERTYNIDFTLSAIGPDIVPQPIVEPEPEPEPEPELKKEIEFIAPPIEIPEPEPEPVLSEACSDFAFPGYDDYGRQIGWIKPEAGAYKFHPFSDKKCNSPTGIYNPNTGFIMDINNKGKRIGSDAEHIGLNTVEKVELPKLSNAPAVRTVNRAEQLTTGKLKPAEKFKRIDLKEAPKNTNSYYSEDDENLLVVSSPSYAQDRSFMLRQYKPIPATIVSDIRADQDALEQGIPVRATVDRNVYSDNGRNVIIPTGTL
ncbi:MAG: hypothetical protein II219_02180, partial [Alphaproteobacteria bacterium]|nr:hypothetical protein [Alphaproteobacteria bacterium]